MTRRITRAEIRFRPPRNSCPTLGRVVAAVVAACVLATCTTNPPETTTPTEPDGISNIKLGMTTNAFEKLYGAAVTERILPPTPGEPTPPYVMLSYRINGQTIDALQGCSISASFLNDFLYEV